MRFQEMNGGVTMTRTQRAGRAWGMLLAGTALIAPLSGAAQTTSDGAYLASAAAAQANQNQTANSSQGLDQPTSQQQQTLTTGTSTSDQPISPVSISGSSSTLSGTTDTLGTSQSTRLLSDAQLRMVKPPLPGEYETWIKQVTGEKLKRYGADLIVPAQRDFAVPATSTIPPDYALNIGDIVSVSLSGSTEGSADFEINRNGEIYMPNVGAVNLVGVHYRDLKSRISDAIGRKYRGYDVTVSMSKLRGVRVYVTGFANDPGAYTVNSLSTLVNAVLAAGGPSAGGSFRSVKLYRNGHEVTDFDLYQLLRKGDRSKDPLLQNEDVLFIPPAGQQVAVFGSVNEPAIYESKPGESLSDVLALAGGPTNLAEHNRLVLYRLSDRDSVGSREITTGQASTEQIASGDILQVLPEGSLVRPLERQQVVVRLEGEVNKPGNYFVAPGTPLSSVVEMAGGLTHRAYVFGTSFQRESVRARQRQGYLDAIDQMETVLGVAPTGASASVDMAERQAQLAAAHAFIQKLKLKEPDGRMVLGMTPTTTELPGDIVLENNDRIVVPPRINTVSVFGAVYRPATFMLDDNRPRQVKDYVEEAGGAVRGSDRGNIFLVRENGEVVTHRRGVMNARVLPGDTIFVPVRAQPSAVWAKIRDISSVLFSFGLTAAAIAAIN